MLTDDEKRQRSREYMVRYRAERPDKIRESQRRYREKHKARVNAAHRARAPRYAYQKHCWREDNREIRAQQLKAWKAANPEKVKAYKQGPSSPEGKARALQKRRLKTLAKAEDKLSQARRIAKQIDKAVPTRLTPDLRQSVISSLYTQVFAGVVSQRPSRSDVQAEVRRQASEISKFGPASLDAPRFDDGVGTLHDVVCEGLWQ